MDDRDLAAQAADGNLDAFGGLFERYARDVYRLARSLGHPRPDAEDLMQDTFLAALEGIGRFEGRSSVRTWLSAILVRQAGSHRRRALRRVTEALEDDTVAAPGIGAATRRLDAHAMLDTLSEEHRTVLVLRELQGLSYDEIAEVLQIPRGTVESRIFRARNLLRERFQEYQTNAPRAGAARPPEPMEARHE